MSVFTAEEGLREMYSEMDDPMVQQLMECYYEDIIEEWSECHARIEDHLKRKHKGK